MSAHANSEAIVETPNAGRPGHRSGPTAALPPTPHPLGFAESTSPARGEVRFAGYVAVFDRADRSGDVILPGAFGAVGPVPLLWQHDPARPAGTIEAIAEDDKGLRVIGRAVGVTAGMGLSFGYRVRRARVGTNRQLHQLELVEVSLVRTPMQPLARVHAVESPSQPFGANPGHVRGT